MLLFFVYIGVFYAPIATGDFLGRLCATEWSEGHHWYPPTGITLQMCLEYCSGYNSSYAGLLSGNQCFCDNSTYNNLVCNPFNQTADCTECLAYPADRCNGDPSMICGGTNWYSLYDVNTVIRTCETSVQYVCSANQFCNWTCDVSMTDGCQYYHIEGTGTYTSDSSYCGAAVHDLRYDLGTAAIVELQRSEGNPQSLQGSWAYDINSLWNHSATDTFRFNSSRLNESISNLNFATVDLSTVKGYCYSTNTQNYSEAFVTLNGTVKSKGNGPKLTEQLQNQPDGMSCALTDSVGEMRYSQTVVPLLLYVKDSDSYPENLTYTVLEGTVNLSITFYTKSFNNATFVFKSDDFLPSTTNETFGTVSYGIAAVSTADAGIYELYSNMSGDFVKLTSTRLIVLPQTADLLACNGKGLKNEQLVCICFHPFAGDECETVVQYGTLGPQGQFNCQHPDCKEEIVCQQDPIGCHCAAGWMGVGCSTPCPQFYYGSDCNFYQMGYCRNDTPVNSFNGLCLDGCADFFYGYFCNLTGPNLVNGPWILNQSYNFATVGWLAWNESTDSGQLGPPAAYILFTDNGSNGTEWVQVEQLNATDENDSIITNFTVDVLDLVPQICYQFTVATVYNGTVQPRSPSTTACLSCLSPLEPPANLKVGVSNNTAAAVEWTVPDNSTWRCDTVMISVNLSCQAKCGEEQVTSMTVPLNQTYVVMTTASYADCFFSSALTVPGELYSPLAVTSVFSTPSSTPSAVGALKTYPLLDGGLIVVWDSPMPPNGQILQYQVVVQPVKAGIFEQLFKAEIQQVDNVNDTSYVIPEQSLVELPVKITVTAQTDAGSGVPTEILYPSLQPTTPNGQPTSALSSSCDYLYYWITIIVLALLLLVLLIVLCVLLFCYFKNGQMKIYSTDFQDDRQPVVGTTYRDSPNPTTLKQTRPNMTNVPTSTL